MLVLDPETVVDGEDGDPKIGEMQEDFFGYPCHSIFCILKAESRLLTIN